MTRMPKPMVQDSVCGTCAHYHQHFVLGARQRWVPLWYGHCDLPRYKHANPDEACERWEENCKGE